MTYQIFYRAEHDGMAPGRVLLPGSDYTRGPEMRAPSLLELQIELNRPPPPPPEPAPRGRRDLRRHPAGVDPGALEEAQANKQPLWVGDVVVEKESARAMILTPELLWARTDATVQEEEADDGEYEYDDL